MGGDLLRTDIKAYAARLCRLVGLGRVVVPTDVVWRGQKALHALRANHGLEELARTNSHPCHRLCQNSPVRLIEREHLGRIHKVSFRGSQ